MSIRCPRCSTAIPLADRDADGWVRCGNCQTRMRVAPPAPSPDPSGADDQLPLPVPVAQPRYYPAPAPPPVYVPVPLPVPGDPPELIQERVEDLRERREGRRERRQYDRDDRETNTLGVAGAAATGTALLLVVSGAIFVVALPGYSCFAVVFGLVITLVGLPLSIIGVVRQGRNRRVPMFGVVAGGLLLLVLIPALMTILIQTRPFVTGPVR